MLLLATFSSSQIVDINLILFIHFLSNKHWAITERRGAGVVGGWRGGVSVSEVLSLGVQTLRDPDCRIPACFCLKIQREPAGTSLTLWYGAEDQTESMCSKGDQTSQPTMWSDRFLPTGIVKSKDGSGAKDGRLKTALMGWRTDASMFVLTQSEALQCDVYVTSMEWKLN